MAEHDFKANPELRNNQLTELLFQSPHKQILEDFRATVVKVVDGDTVRLQTNFRDFDFPLRISKINAKEMNEGGEEAKAWLTGLLLNEEIDIILDPERVEKWGRLLGEVRHNGLDVGEQLIFLGFATTWDNRHEGKIRDTIKIPTFEVKA